MKKLLTMCTAGLMGATGFAVTAGAATTASPGAATTTSTSFVPVPPVQSMHSKALALYVDTVVGGGGNPKPAVSCAQTNMFHIGQTVVFRMWGNVTRTGGTPLTDRNVRGAFVTIPGVGKLAMSYSAHGKVAFWTAAWPTAGYPSVGTVNFTVSVVTNPVRQWGMASGKHSKIGALTGVFSQAGTAPTSQLTLF